MVDGATSGPGVATDTTAPYAATLDTEGLGDGLHTVRAYLCRDAVTCDGSRAGEAAVRVVRLHPGIVSVSPFPARDELLVRFFNWAGDVRIVERVIVTVTVDGSTVQRPVARRDESSFTVPYEFPDDTFAVTVIARDADDDRLYATFDIDPDRPDR